MGTDEEDDLLAIEDEVYQKTTIKLQLDEVPEKRFKPWHKPRKHYLRVYQWCQQIATLIKDLGLGESDSLRYLGMPGEDLLDVRTLQGVCCMSTDPKVAVELLASYSYRIEHNEPDMLSLAFRFEPVIQARIDDTGLGRTTTAPAMPTEESLRSRSSRALEQFRMSTSCWPIMTR